MLLTGSIKFGLLRETLIRSEYFACFFAFTVCIPEAIQLVTILIGYI